MTRSELTQLQGVLHHAQRVNLAGQALHGLLTSPRLAKGLTKEEIAAYAATYALLVMAALDEPPLPPIRKPFTA